MNETEARAGIIAPGLSVETLFASERLCLDFINTEYRRREIAVDIIATADQLRRWLRMAEDIRGLPLCEDEDWDAKNGETILLRAVELRTALRTLVQSAIDKTPASATAIEVVNAILRTNPAYTQLGVSNGTFRESFSVIQPREKWLVAIANDAVDLLCHADLSLLRQCEYPTCIRVFYDTTKNHKKRWCAEKCGSHSKAAAYYRRKVAKAVQTRIGTPAPKSQ
ncbi:MAG: CGNR zinc finger domain-containing protein [Capsulimonadaceae bacterium]|nr:CGNR zinc finger domain-containing protein [Capsulimonadaceae bacterium]